MHSENVKKEQINLFPIIFSPQNIYILTRIEIYAMMKLPNQLNIYVA